MRHRITRREEAARPPPPRCSAPDGDDAVDTRRAPQPGFPRRAGADHPPRPPSPPKRAERSEAAAAVSSDMGTLFRYAECLRRGGGAIRCDNLVARTSAEDRAESDRHMPTPMLPHTPVTASVF